MTRINAGFSICSKHQIIWEELIYEFERKTTTQDWVSYFQIAHKYEQYMTQPLNIMFDSLDT